MRKVEFPHSVREQLLEGTANAVLSGQRTLAWAENVSAWFERQYRRFESRSFVRLRRLGRSQQYFLGVFSDENNRVLDRRIGSVRCRICFRLNASENLVEVLHIDFEDL